MTQHTTAHTTKFSPITQAELRGGGWGVGQFNLPGKQCVTRGNLAAGGVEHENLSDPSPLGLTTKPPLPLNLNSHV